MAGHQGRRPRIWTRRQPERAFRRGPGQGREGPALHVRGDKPAETGPDVGSRRDCGPRRRAPAAGQGHDRLTQSGHDRNALVAFRAATDTRHPGTRAPRVFRRKALQRPCCRRSCRARRRGHCHGVGPLGEELAGDSAGAADGHTAHPLLVGHTTRRRSGGPRCPRARSLWPPAYVCRSTVVVTVGIR